MKQCFKRSTAWLLCLAMVLGLFAGIPGLGFTKARAEEQKVTVEEINLLEGSNPSFEDYSIPGWERTDGVAQSKDKATEGNTWSLKINVKDASVTSKDAVAVAPYWTYNASVKVWGAGKLTVVMYNAEGKVVAEKSAEAATTEWADLSVAIDAPADAATAVVKLSSTTADAVYFDDASLTAGEASMEIGLLNGGLDEWNAAQTVPTDWEVSTGATVATPVAEAVDGRGYVATYTAKNQTMTLRSNVFDVVPGMVYATTIDLLAEVAEGATCNYQYLIRFWDADGNQLNQKHDDWSDTYVGGAFTGSNDWQTVVHQGLAPEGAATARLWLTVYTASTYTLKVDNATVSMSNGVIDGSYENTAIETNGAPMGHRFKSKAGSAAVNTDPAYVMEGKQSINLTGVGARLHSVPMNVLPGETYKATVYLKTTEEAAAQWAASTSSFQFYVIWSDATGTRLSAGNLANTSVKATAEWTAIELQGKAPEGAAAADILILNAPKLPVYIDCESFEHVPTELLANADFEERTTGTRIAAEKWSVGNANGLELSQIEYIADRGYVLHFAGFEGSNNHISSSKFAVTENTEYKFEMQAKATATTQFVQFYVDWWDADGTRVGARTTIKQLGIKDLEGGDWITLTKNLTVPAGATQASFLIAVAGLYDSNGALKDENGNTITGDVLIDNVAMYLACDHDSEGWDTDIEGVDATCTSVGYAYAECTNCGALKVTEIPMLDHAYTATETVAPNCTEQGYTLYTCGSCGGTKKDDLVDAIGTAHVWVKNDDGSYACEKCDIAPVYLDVENNNLVLNPSFEEYEIPGWTIENGVAQSKNTDGTWSLKINVEGACAVSDAVTAVGGYAYTASAAVTGNGKVGIVFYDAEGKLLAEGDAEAVAPAGTAKAAVKLSSTSAEAVYFDDVALAMGSITQPVLSNADMAALDSKGMPTGWTVAGEAAAEVVVDAERGNVVQYTREANDYNLLSPHFEVIPGLTYSVTMDIWQDVAAYGQFYIKFFNAEGSEIKEYDENGKQTWSAHRYIVINETLAANEWHTLQVSGIAPVNAVTARIQVVSVGGANNSVVATVKFAKATAQVSNGLYNASFEDNAVQASGLPMGSTYKSTETATNYSWISSTAEVGTQSVATISKNQVFSNFISVIPGETYTATADVITDAEHLPEWALGYYGQGKQCLINTYLYFYDARGNQLETIGQKTGVPTATEWTTIVNSKTAPEGAVAARFMFYTTLGAVAYVDNLTFAQSSEMGQITLTNANFETRKTYAKPSDASGTTLTNTPDWFVSASSVSEKISNAYADAAHGYAMHIEDHAMTIWTKFIEVEAGATYKLSADAMGSGGLQLYLRYYLEGETDRSNYITVTGAVESDKQNNENGKVSADAGKNLIEAITNEWTTYAVADSVAPKDAKLAMVWIVGTKDANGVTDVYVDNVSLTKVCDTHNWGAPVVNDPTCVEDGTVVYTCSDCGAIGTAEGEKSKNEHTVPTAGHKDYIEPSLDKPGYYVYDCAVCGEEFTIEDANAPQLEAVADVDGTEYATIEEAVAALVDNATLTLKKDIDLTQYGTSFKLISKALNGVTIDGDGHKFIGVVRLQPAAECTDLTIENVIFSTGDIAGDKKTLLDENGNEVKADITDDVGYLVVSTGTHVNLTIQNCQFLDGAYISQSNPEIENLTIDSCLFDGCANLTGTASAVVLKNVNNAVINNNTIRNIQWNAFQIGYSTGVFDFTENTIEWSVPEGNEPDGVFNLYSFTDAEVYLDGNTVTGTCVDAGRSVVQFQYDDTANVALFDYDDLTVTHKAEDGTTDIFKNVDYIEDEECTRYCTGHIYDEEGFCTVCYAEKPAEEVTGTITANGHSLSLEGNIWINKYVIIEGFEGVDLTKDAGLLIWTSEIAEEDAVFGTGNPIVKEGLLYNGLYGGKPEYGQLTDGIKAPFYGNKLYMRVYVKVGETYHYGAFTAYSVEDYCRGRIQKSSDAALKTLCAAVLEYGAMAQIRFSNVEGVNTEVLVNEGLDSSLKTEFSEEMIVALDTEYETKITAADTAIVSANGRSISLNEGLLINYYFKTTLTNIQSAELLTWDKEVEGELTYENATKTALTYAGGEYAASGALVPAPYCGDTIYACARFVDAEGAEYYTAVDAYSTHKYAENQFAKANLTEANRNLLEALIVYSHLANTKFAK